MGNSIKLPYFSEYYHANVNKSGEVSMGKGKKFVELDTTTQQLIEEFYEGCLDDITKDVYFFQDVMYEKGNVVYTVAYRRDKDICLLGYKPEGYDSFSPLPQRTKCDSQPEFYDVEYTQIGVFTLNYISIPVSNEFGDYVKNVTILSKGYNDYYLIPGKLYQYNKKHTLGMAPTYDDTKYAKYERCDGKTTKTSLFRLEYMRMIGDEHDYLTWCVTYKTGNVGLVGDRINMRMAQCRLMSPDSKDVNNQEFLLDEPSFFFGAYGKVFYFDDGNIIIALCFVPNDRVRIIHDGKNIRRYVVTGISRRSIPYRDI